jgi:hypothetical protein
LGQKFGAFLGASSPSWTQTPYFGPKAPKFGPKKTNFFFQNRLTIRKCTHSGPISAQRASICRAMTFRLTHPKILMVPSRKAAREGDRFLTSLYLWSGWSKSARCWYNVEEHILGVLFMVFSCFFVVCGVRGAPFQKAKIVKFWGQVRGHREGGRCCLSLGCT